ncbi:MAG: hypothetical protein HZA34_03180 [Candidatus Pacebacteria bacterium]|nr:hypothetical protein [Candidatus Paceibacterota bacterium]
MPYEVEGYIVVAKRNDGRGGDVLGNRGTSENYPAMSRALAEKFAAEQPQMDGVEYTLQLINARFVEQLTGVVVDNNLG